MARSGPPPPLEPWQHRREVLPPAAVLLDESPVKVGRGRPERRFGAGGLGRLLAQAQVLEHQLGGEARAVAVVRGALGADARRGAVGRERPGLPRGRAGDVVERPALEAEAVGQRKGLAGGDHRHAEDHVVAELGRLPVARGPAMDGARAHDLQERGNVLEGFPRAAHHEGQRARRRARRAPRHRRVERRDPRGLRALGHGAGAFHVHRRAVEQHRAPPHGRDDLLGHRAQHGAVGQHGDHHRRAVGGLGRARNHPHAPGLDPGRVAAHDLVAGRGEVLGHGAAHVAQAHEPDPHALSLRLKASRPSGRSMAETSAGGTASTPA